MADQATPTLSIVVPNRNGNRFLGACLDSLFSQSFPSMEVLVQDGGSTDGSVETIKSYASRIAHWESAPDSGQAHALQKGLSKARGTWFYYLNSDDVLLPGVLEHVAAHFNSSANWLAGTIFYMDENGQRIGQREPVWEAGDLSKWITYGHALPQMGVFVRRETLKQCGGFNTAFARCMDTELWMRLEHRGNAPTKMNLSVAGFRLHEASKTAAGRLPFIAEHRKMLENYSEALSGPQKRLCTTVLNSLEAEQHVYLASDEAFMEGLRLLRKAAMLAPQVVTKRYFWGAVRRLAK